jgi:acetyltransferase-like isoleucine patch superfamily enzyme
VGTLKFIDEADNPPPAGPLDRFIRHFHRSSYGAAVVLLYALASSALGLALVPSLLLVSRLGPGLWLGEHWYRWPLLGASLGAALFLWGFALLIVVPIYNFVLPTRLHAFRGGYFTAAALPWYLHNGLFYLVRFTFLPFVTLTPFGILFLRAMGMKIGRRVRITTENFSDVNMITLGDDVVIGGSAHVFCHYGGAGHLVIAPVVIERRATIGEKATLMGDVRVGEGATVLAHAVLMPGTRVGPGETWGGAPARLIPREEWSAYKEMLRGSAGHP